jgi:hypothetical protein
MSGCGVLVFAGRFSDDGGDIRDGTSHRFMVQAPTLGDVQTARFDALAWLRGIGVR